jgi:hypothetical protein
MKKMICGLVVIIMMTVCLSGYSEGPDKSHREAAKTLYRTMSPRDNFITAVCATFEANIENLKKRGVPQNKLKKMREAVKDFAKKVVDDPAFKKKMISAYAETFTRPEIEKLMNFYNTPEGKTILKKFPKLFRKGSKVGREISGKYQPELQKRMRNIMMGRSNPGK